MRGIMDSHIDQVSWAGNKWMFTLLILLAWKESKHLYLWHWDFISTRGQFPLDHSTSGSPAALGQILEGRRLFVAPILAPERGSFGLRHFATESTHLIGRNIEFRTDLWPFYSRSGNRVVRQWQTPLFTLSNHSAQTDLTDPSQVELIQESSPNRWGSSMARQSCPSLCPN